eukprot:gnl/MRDRNA2_/MRDRNA2_24733_c0_seq1.p1 gnl/MRDRNA2_/MRDRNA2_24733_c0~~gnl/MRDRNA2_/MRDRNA2_24733_c0_seq1.p1  ORF type:complete len:701 (+),score=119.23 gnl/MRDRNA2_/MRDRNA2_24733_c0_seq1:110-2212(+)
MQLAVYFPKTVMIENSRLAVLYYIIAAGAVFLVLNSFVTSQAYLTSGNIKGQVFFWAMDWDIHDRIAATINEESADLDVCRHPQKYEFCADPACAWRYENLHCIDICTEDQHDSCVEKHERFTKTENGLFFPTYYDETAVLHSVQGERTVIKEHIIIKGVEEMAVGFDHEYIVETKGQLERGGSSPSEQDTGVLTILQDDDGNLVDSWKPHEPVAIALKVLLSVAGVSLDDLNLNAGTNHKPGAGISEGVLMRISGLQLSVEMSYRNKRRHKEDWNGPVCYIAVRATKQWTSKPKVDALDQYGSSRLRYYYGVQVQFSTAGSFGWVDPGYLTQSILNLITQVFVMIGVAQKAVFFIAMYLLGYLSKVYGRYVYQQVCLGRECEGLAARLVSFSETFHSIRDVSHGVTERRIFRRFKKIFKYHEELESKEIMRIAKVFFNTMAEEVPHEVHGPIINMQEFSQACCANEALTFDLLAGIFDADRKRSIMESCFEDDSIRRLYAGDASVPSGWSQSNTSMTKVLDDAKPKETKMGFSEKIKEQVSKKKKKLGKPLFHVFQEADEATALNLLDQEDDDISPAMMAQQHSNGMPDGVLEDIIKLNEQVQMIQAQNDDVIDLMSSLRLRENGTDCSYSSGPSPMIREAQPAMPLVAQHNPADFSRCDRGVSLLSCFGSASPALNLKDETTNSSSWPQPPQNPTTGN